MVNYGGHFGGPRTPYKAPLCLFMSYLDFFVGRDALLGCPGVQNRSDRLLAVVGGRKEHVNTRILYSPKRGDCRNHHL